MLLTKHGIVIARYRGQYQVCKYFKTSSVIFGKKISRDGKVNLANIIGLFEKFVMVSPLALWLIAGN